MFRHQGVESTMHVTSARRLDTMDVTVQISIVKQNTLQRLFHLINHLNTGLYVD